MVPWFLLIGSMAPDAAILSSHFDLSEMRHHLHSAGHPADRGNRYRISAPADGRLWDGGDDDGISIKLRGTRVKLRMPIPSI